MSDTEEKSEEEPSTSGNPDRNRNPAGPDLDYASGSHFQGSYNIIKTKLIQL